MDPRGHDPMPLAARRTFRLAATVGLALSVSYGIGAPLPYLAPLLAFFLTAKPSSPLLPKQLLVAALALFIILGTGVVIAPWVSQYPPVGITVVAVGLFISSRLSIAGEKAAVGTLLAAGLTLVSAMGVISLALAQAIITALVIAFVLAVLAQWVTWPLFAESSVELEDSHGGDAESIMGLQRRAANAVVVILPAYLFLLSNPTGNTPVMMKAIVLAQTGSARDARQAARELLGATLVGGVLAATLWFALKLAPNLWFFALWVGLAMVWIARHLYLPRPTGPSVQFWIDTAVTCLILLGAAVSDSANGKDPYQGFLFRFGLFTLVSVYAWVAFTLMGRVTHLGPQTTQLQDV